MCSADKFLLLKISQIKSTNSSLKLDNSIDSMDSGNSGLSSCSDFVDLRSIMKLFGFFVGLS